MATIFDGEIDFNKPDFVHYQQLIASNHSSRIKITFNFEQPTRICRFYNQYLGLILI